MVSYNASKERGPSESQILIDASMECNQGSSSRPRKSPRLIDHAQHREFIQTEMKK
ncbi:hypothetical protein MKX01_034483, partial [Papaver californicum]